MDTQREKYAKGYERKKICDLPQGEEVVGMVTFDNEVIVATTLGIWRLENDELVPIVFLLPDDIHIVDKGEITVGCQCGWIGIDAYLEAGGKLKICPECKKPFTAFPRRQK